MDRIKEMTGPSTSDPQQGMKTLEYIFNDLLRYGWPGIHKRRSGGGWAARQDLNIMLRGHDVKVTASGKTAREALEKLQQNVAATIVEIRKKSAE